MPPAVKALIDKRSGLFNNEVEDYYNFLSF
jgi:hypothetical protein